MPNARVKLNRAGAKQLLGDPGVAAELARLAGKVAQRAGGSAHVEQTTTAGYRAVARVVDDSPGALAREAQTGDLAAALDAAR